MQIFISVLWNSILRSLVFWWNCLKKVSKENKINHSFLKKAARQTFRRFIKTFIKALILIYFNFKNLIKIKLDISEFVIATILSQLITFVIDVKQTQWHSIVFYLRKMIFAEIKYEMHDQELLFIVVAFQQ